MQHTVQFGLQAPGQPTLLQSPTESTLVNGSTRCCRLSEFRALGKDAHVSFLWPEREGKEMPAVLRAARQA